LAERGDRPPAHGTKTTMKTFLAGAACAAIFATAAIAQASAALTINLDCADGRGQVLIAVFDSKIAYETDKPVRRLAAQPGKPVRLDGLQPGRYAIKSFHDIDGDGRMGTNPFGIPTEPFAFSNNARGSMGPASWEAAAFDVPAAGATQTLVLK